MDQRDILSRIRDRYPARLYLAFVGGKSLRLRYGAGLSQDMRLRLQASLAQIPLDLRGEDAPADLELGLDMGPCPGEPGDVLWLSWGERRYACPGEDAADTLPWVLYCLAKDLPALRALDRAKLRAMTYSASQQALAAKLLRSADYWQRTLGTAVLPKLLEEHLLQGVKDLAELAPRCTDRPFTAAGRERLQAASGLIVRERQVRLSALARELYGDRPFEESLRAWCGRMERDPAFLQAQKQARERIARELFRLPMMEVPVRLRDAVQELTRRFDPGEDLEKAGEALKAQTLVKRLSPETIERAFAAANGHYRAAAHKMIASAMLEPVAAWLKERVEEQMPSALRTLQDWNRSLRDFCRIQTGDERLPIGWDRCGELRDEDLTVAEDGWTGPMLRDLYTSSGIRGGYYVLTWAGSPWAYEGAGNAIAEMARGMIPLQGMTEQLVVALMQQPIPMEGRYDG